jgi:hypothetical protein
MRGLYIVVFGRYGVNRGRLASKIVSYFITTVSGTHLGNSAKAGLVIFLGINWHERLLHCWSGHYERVGFNGHFIIGIFLMI